MKVFNQLIIETLETFYIKKCLYEFDPHVGDTACQIRSYQVMLMSMSVTETQKQLIYSKLEELRQLARRIDKDINYYKKVDSTRQKVKHLYTTLERFVLDKKYYVELDEVSFYLTQVRMLALSLENPNS